MFQVFVFMGLCTGAHISNNESNSHLTESLMMQSLCNFSGGSGSIGYDANIPDSPTCLGRKGAPCNEDKECDNEGLYVCKGPPLPHLEFKYTCVGVAALKNGEFSFGVIIGEGPVTPLNLLFAF